MTDRRALFPGFLVLACLILLSCQLSTPRPVATVTPAPPEVKATAAPPQATLVSPLKDPNVANAARTERANRPVLQPTATVVAQSIGDISIEYLYTSGLVTSLYHLYGSYLDHFVDIYLTNGGAEPVTVLVETFIDGYTTHSVDTVEVGAGERAEVHQNPRLTPDAIDRLASEQPGSFRIRVAQLVNGDEKTLLDESKEILLYSRRDFVWIDGLEASEEYELWAAWVTPTDPGVEALIRAAADYTESGTMGNGYGGAENDESGEVWDRLDAIWQAEANEYRLTYVSTMLAFGPNTVQRMRLPAEVLDQSSGNCVELAALFASAAEALKLETAIIRIPGHAYMAVRMDEVNANYYFVETTLIGRASFDDAVSVGKSEWEETLPHLDAQEEGYAWVTVQDAWEKGITPIPWR